MSRLRLSYQHSGSLYDCPPCNQRSVLPFRVLSKSSHYVILGCDFLTENEAVVDYIRNGVLL